MTKIIIYTTKTCPWCKKSKEWFKEHKISFTNVDVTSDEKGRDAMIEKSGQMGVPVIEIGKEIIVGFNPEAFEEALKKIK
ncbi:glutaredoxin family protein [Candidatus Woesearchaeota archaeon]|jgi:glutaredoxin 3|nr:glutaredoxin family protein [Candidatus Woesearchaeota archaeon]MBT4150926.1 glutaredoxin family protein [Candidatus Woesearchaeota archaeon]MBT4247099.1 glutaredoxin family protein [Candidatus Woesearchaeota archaeon]MBT4433716.1 glutaredoxin family protein [Candidatus Woesearchaeota archaeon]